MKNETKHLTLLAMGIALFVVLSICLRVPVFENYYLCLGYIVMTVYIWCFEWYDGAIVGFLGVILYCIVGNLGFNGMPGWALGNVVIGLIIGLFLKQIKKIKSKPLVFLATAVVAIISTFIGIGIIKSLVDMFIVQQPFAVRFAKNFSSFVADAVVIVISIPACFVLEKYVKKLIPATNTTKK